MSYRQKDQSKRKHDHLMSCTDRVEFWGGGCRHWSALLVSDRQQLPKNLLIISTLYENMHNHYAFFAIDFNTHLKWLVKLLSKFECLLYFTSSLPFRRLKKKKKYSLNEFTWVWCICLLLKWHALPPFSLSTHTHVRTLMRTACMRTHTHTGLYKHNSLF